MTSAIDITKPASGTPTTASVRANFASAKSEIEALQAEAQALIASKQPLDATLTALASLLMARRVRPYLSMTGEVTLSGLVLPVGGIKEKVLAARRAGVKEVILSRENKVNVDEDLQPEQIEDLKIHFVETVEEVLDLALVPPEHKPAKAEGAAEPEKEDREVAASQPVS